MEVYGVNIEEPNPEKLECACAQLESELQSHGYQFSGALPDIPDWAGRNFPVIKRGPYGFRHIELYDLLKNCIVARLDTVCGEGVILSD